MDKQIEEMAKIIVNELKIDKYWALVISETIVNAGYGDLRAFAEKLKNKAIRQQEFVGELAIGDIEYVKVKDIDKTLNEFLGE